MAIIGMFFQAEIGFCAPIVCYDSARQEIPQRLWLRAPSAPERITSQCQFALHDLSSWNVCCARPAFSTQQVWLINVSFLLLYIHASLPMRWALDCAGNEQFHDVTCTDCRLDNTMPSTHDESNDMCRCHIHVVFHHIVYTLLAVTCHIVPKPNYI